MSKKNCCFGIGIALVFGVCLSVGAPHATVQKKQLKPSNEIIEYFPSKAKMETAWKVRWATTIGFGLYIQGAWYKRSPNEPWMQVLGDARVSEVFVPYHEGEPRFWDVSYNFSLKRLKDGDAGMGKIIGKNKDVAHEVRDRGPIYVETGQGVRRGKKLTLWAALEAANYFYLMEYNFRDDGGMVFRLGSTGRNYSGSEWVPHMHNSLWRIDMNLDGPNNNTVKMVEHIEPVGKKKKKAKTVYTDFNGGREGGAVWNAEKFTKLQVVHTKRKNKQGKAMTYDLIPVRMGNARHFHGKDEKCTQFDFWVTKANPKEIYYVQLPKYAQNKESIVDTNVVLWHSAPAHHEPRSEDGEFQGNSFVGATPTMWAGFMLLPRNIHDRSPFYPYGKGK